MMRTCGVFPSKQFVNITEWPDTPEGPQDLINLEVLQCEFNYQLPYSHRYPGRPVVTSAMVGAKILKHGVFCSETVFQRLPLYVKERLTCLCHIDYRGLCGWYNELGLKTGGSYCLKCSKPRRFSVSYIYFECDACERFGVPNPRKESFRNGKRAYDLCSRCDV